MKKALIIIVAIAAFFLIGYQNKTIIAQEANKIIYQSKCDTPIPYGIGTIDSRFNITKDEFLTNTQEAANIWGTTIGKKLFVYDPEAKLTINLTYDERQSLNTQINQLDTKLEEEKNKVLDPQIADYERKSATLRSKFAALNKEIEEWNSKGGAPEDVYKRLNDEQGNLKREADALNRLAASLNQSTRNYNEQVDKLRDTVNTYNETLNYKPEEGIYISDEKGERIIIYFYTTKQELVHTLAHEMGHALSIEHVNNPQAIMFSKTNNVVTPSAEDIALLTEVCRKRHIIDRTREELPVKIYEFREGIIKKVNTTLNSL